MKKTEYNTYQQYKGFEQMQKNIFTFADRSGGIAEYSKQR